MRDIRGKNPIKTRVHKGKAKKEKGEEGKTKNQKDSRAIRSGDGSDRFSVVAGEAMKKTRQGDLLSGELFTAERFGQGRRRERRRGCHLSLSLCLCLSQRPESKISIIYIYVYMYNR